MKRIVILLSALFVSASALLAQDRPLSIGVQGGLIGSGNENASVFFENKKATELLNYGFGAWVGYDFSNRFGVRLAGSYGTNVGANSNFDKYTFKSINAFVDCMLNLVGEDCRFVPKVYLGIGGAKTMNFSAIPTSLKPHVNTDGVLVPGARAGLNLEFRLFSGLGIFVDGAIEGYPDSYNGIQGKRSFELRAVGSAGVAFHF